MRIFIFLCIFLQGLVHNAQANSQVSEQIVSFYENDNCLEIEKAYKENSSTKFTPLVLAVIASCLNDKDESIRLFNIAEKEKPNNQTILMLYAMFQQKFDNEATLNIWRKIHLITNDESIKRMAEDYLSGVVDIHEQEKVSLGRGFSGWLYGNVGANYTTNPFDSSNSTWDPDSASYGQIFNLHSRLKHIESWGDWGGQLAVTSENFYSEHTADKLFSRIDLPVSLDASNEGTVTFSPFFSNELQGNSPYYRAIGLYVLGSTFQNNYRQSVQGIIYRDNFIDPTLNAQEGSHYRFEYEWYFYPSWYEFTFGASIEHVHASKDDDEPNNATIFYSHNDIGAFGAFLARLQLIEYSLYFLGSTRRDTNDSTFLQNGIQVNRARVDYSFELRPQVAVPLEKRVKLSVYYDLLHTYSNFGADDYQDFNEINQVLGMTVDFQMEWL